MFAKVFGLKETANDFIFSRVHSIKVVSWAHFEFFFNTLWRYFNIFTRDQNFFRGAPS